MFPFTQELTFTMNVVSTNDAAGRSMLYQNVNGL